MPPDRKYCEEIKWPEIKCEKVRGEKMRKHYSKHPINMRSDKRQIENRKGKRRWWRRRERAEQQVRAERFSRTVRLCCKSLCPCTTSPWSLVLGPLKPPHALKRSQIPPSCCSRCPVAVFAMQRGSSMINSNVIFGVDESRIVDQGGREAEITATTAEAEKEAVFEVSQTLCREHVCADEWRVMTNGREINCTASLMLSR